MKLATALTAAVFGGALVLAAPAFAQNKGSSTNAPGQKQTTPGTAKDFAPGQRQTSPGDAKNFAPGQQPKTTTTKKK